MSRAPLLAWLIVAALCGAPYARAHLQPPPGQAFIGAFHFPDDVYNYLGYVEQAARGAFLFQNKASAAPHSAALVNLEWWAVGRLSAALGGRPLLAWRLFALAASLAFVLLVDAWLRRAGLPAGHRLPALLLVLLGGGLGGLFQALRWPARLQPLDLTTGLFPFMELLANPHFVLGTALLMGSVLLLMRDTRAGALAGAGLATVTGIVRPYDLVMAAAIAAAWVAIVEPPRRWFRRLAPLLLLAPVVAYLAWVFFAQPAYRTFAAEEYPPPPLRWVALAFLPALALAAAARPWRTGEGEARDTRTALWCWAAVAAAIAIARPVPFSLQFLAGAGTPLLCLAALGLGRQRPWVTLLVAAVFSTGAVASLRHVSRADAQWFVPAGRLAAARALGSACRAGEIALAPRDVGLYALAYAPCVPYVSHPAVPGASEREREVRGFYGEWTPARRAAFVQGRGIGVLVLPGAAGEQPVAWMGEGSGFSRVRLVEAGGEALGVYARPPAPAAGGP